MTLQDQCGIQCIRDGGAVCGGGFCCARYGVDLCRLFLVFADEAFSVRFFIAEGFRGGKADGTADRALGKNADEDCQSRFVSLGDQLYDVAAVFTEVDLAHGRGERFTADINGGEADPVGHDGKERLIRFFFFVFLDLRRGEGIRQGKQDGDHGTNADEDGDIFERLLHALRPPNTL